MDDQPTRTDRKIEGKLRASFADLEPPEQLWSRIRDSVRDEERTRAEPDSVSPRSHGRQHSRRQWSLAAALAAVVIAGVLASKPLWLDGGVGGNAQALQPSVLADEFATFIASERSFDISSADADTLHTWFSTRLKPIPPNPPAKVDLQLAGGRLCQIQRRRVAAYMYEFNGTTISVYVTQVPGDETPAPAAPTLIYAHENYTFATWRKEGWEYSAVADLPPDVMAEIAQRLATTG